MGFTSSYGGSISSLGLDAVGSGSPNSTSGAALVGTDASAIGASAGSTDTVQGVLEALHTAIAAAGGGGTVQGTDGTYDIQPANEGATAGNARGENSVDLQTERTLATQVASGQLSGIPCGGYNTASNFYAMASGSQCTASGHSSRAHGATCTASGGYSRALGRSCLSGGEYSTGLGYFASASHHGEVSQASGAFASSSGSAQASRLTWFDQTTSATQAEMFLDNSSARFTLSNDDLYHATIKVLAVNTANGSHAIWTFFNVSAVKNSTSNVVVTNGGASVAPDVNYNNGTDMSVCLVDVDADTSNQALRIQVTGIAATTINWFAYADCGKVNY